MKRWYFIAVEVKYIRPVLGSSETKFWNDINLK